MAVVAYISFTAAIQREGREEVYPKKTNLINSIMFHNP